MATQPNFYQPDAADAASEGLNESNPDQISWGVFFHLLKQRILFLFLFFFAV